MSLIKTYSPVVQNLNILRYRAFSSLQKALCAWYFPVNLQTPPLGNHCFDFY